MDSNPASITNSLGGLRESAFSWPILQGRRKDWVWSFSRRGSRLFRGSPVIQGGFSTLRKAVCWQLLTLPCKPGLSFGNTTSKPNIINPSMRMSRGVGSKEDATFIPVQRCVGASPTNAAEFLPVDRNWMCHSQLREGGNQHSHPTDNQVWLHSKQKLMENSSTLSYYHED